MLDRIVIGIISSTHGLKGEVKVYPTTDEVRRFSELREVTAELPDGDVRLEVERAAYFKGKPILKFKGRDRIEDVMALRGAPLLVDRADALPLAEGEYFVGDLVGSSVVLEDGEDYGVLSDILRTGANDVYEVRRPDGSMSYLPAIRQVVLEIDAGNRRITVRPMKEI